MRQGWALNEERNMEAVKKTEEAPTNGNGHGVQSVVPPPVVQEPDEIKIEREDCLALLVLDGKMKNLELQRSQVELQRQLLSRENDDIVKAFSAKYGVNLSEYTVNTDIGVAKKRG